MPTYSWWIDEPRVMASSNPSDEDLARLRAQGFSVVVSLLDEKAQPPRYDKKAAALAGWVIWSVPVGEGGAPSLDQLSELTARMRALPEGTKVLVHCESGLGRSAFLGAVYWVAKGLPASEAVARVRPPGLGADWLTPQREKLLSEYARIQPGAVTKEAGKPSA
jgi:protein-tyrosine phosphatase